ncbi:MAG: glycerol-3-phosphate 1-O-acyltransferase PlsY [Bdellovibrionales bacterium]
MIFFSLFAVSFFAYVLGSIPFGLVLTRLAGLGDIRAIGSGNIGATNVLRTGNKTLAALTLLLDALKGVAAVLFVAAYFPGLVEVAALAAVLGHMFPLWLRFKGGKGVATSIGVIAALNWPTGLAVFVLWLPVVIFLRISSLATLIVSASVPVFFTVFGRVDLVPFSLVLLVLVFFKHRENIRRLINHTEPKIGQLRNDAPPPQRG